MSLVFHLDTYPHPVFSLPRGLHFKQNAGVPLLIDTSLAVHSGRTLFVTHVYSVVLELNDNTMHHGLAAAACAQSMHVQFICVVYK